MNPEEQNGEYRDVVLIIGLPCGRRGKNTVLCELRVTLSTMAVLRSSEQKLIQIAQGTTERRVRRTSVVAGQTKGSAKARHLWQTHLAEALPTAATHGMQVQLKAGKLYNLAS